MLGKPKGGFGQETFTLTHRGGQGKTFQGFQPAECR